MTSAGVQNIFAGDICIGSVYTKSYERPCGWTVDNRRNGRSHCCFLYVYCGCAEFTREGRPTLTAKSGDLIFIPQGAEYLLRYSDESNRFTLLNFTMTDQHGIKYSVEEIMVFSGICGFDLTMLFESISEAGGRESAVSRFYLKEAVYRLLRLICEDNGEVLMTNDSRFSKIGAGVYILTHNYTSDIPIDELASACNISISSFRSLFTECFGMPPIRYRNSLRIKRAKQLLSDHDCTVSEAAFAVGFSSESYFSRVYKQFSGTSPINDRK